MLSLQIRRNTMKSTTSEGQKGVWSLTRKFDPSIGARSFRGAVMAITDLFVRKLKHSGKPSGDKYSDGRSLYLFV